MSLFWFYVRDLVLHIFIVVINALLLPFSAFLCIRALVYHLWWATSDAVPTPTVVAITGASTGIGEAFAYENAKSKASLVLLARSKERLERVADACRDLGAPDVKVIVMDVSDTKGLSLLLSSKTNEWGIDLFIANAGISGGSGDQSLSQNETVFQINVLGALAGATAFYDALREQGRHGQIAIVTSVFGFFGPARLANYNATKAALSSYTRDLRALGKRHGIYVSAVHPGFVRTNMTKGAEIPQWMTLAPETLARLVKSGLKHNIGVISAPFHQYLIFYIFQTLPPLLKQFVSNNFLTTSAQERMLKDKQ